MMLYIVLELHFPHLPGISSWYLSASSEFDEGSRLIVQTVWDDDDGNLSSFTVDEVSISILL